MRLQTVEAGSRVEGKQRLQRRCYGFAARQIDFLPVHGVLVRRSLL